MPNAETIYLSLDESLQLVPFDALPLASGRLAGEEKSIRTVVSLFDLCEERAAAASASPPSLLALGGIEYDAAGAEVSGDREEGAPAPAFMPLANTAAEVAQIAELFARTHEGGSASTLVGAAARKAALFAAAPASASTWASCAPWAS